MKCRCAEIEKYEAELETLSIVEESLELAAGTQGTITSALSAASGYFVQAVFLGSMDALSQQLGNSASPISAAEETSAGECTSAISTVSTELSDMRKEDDAYHAAIAAAAKAAAAAAKLQKSVADAIKKLPSIFPIKP